MQDFCKNKMSELYYERVMLKLENFDRIRRYCRKWKRNPFHTSPRGYKMRLSACLQDGSNRDENGYDTKNTYLSIYGHIFKRWLWW